MCFCNEKRSPRKLVAIRYCVQRRWPDEPDIFRPMYYDGEYTLGSWHNGKDATFYLKGGFHVFKTLQGARYYNHYYNQVMGAPNSVVLQCKVRNRIAAGTVYGYSAERWKERLLIRVVAKRKSAKAKAKVKKKVKSKTTRRKTR